MSFLFVYFIYIYKICVYKGSETDTLMLGVMNSLRPVRKLKKMYREYKEEKEGGGEKKKKKDKDPSRTRQRWDLDYQLEPYEGLSPEYMEMSECIRTEV